MAIKETKRRAFNFLRSYFDVFNELKTDKDKLDFLTAILNKQFLDEDPKDLTFIVNLCYESQRHQIETSVKGWKRATKDTLGTTPLTPLRTTPSTPKQEEEEKEEVKEETISVINFEKLLYYINLSFDRQFRTINNKVKQSFKARLKEGYTNEDIKNCIDNIKNNKYHIENGYQYCTPEYISRPVTLDKFSKVNSKVAKETTTLDDYASNVMKQVEALKNLNK